MNERAARRGTAQPLSGLESPWPLPEERARERELKRDAVVMAAARLFARAGFHATSLDDVANALGVTKPTIYHYFANKDEILFECMRRGLTAIALAGTEATKARGANGLERLEAMMRAYARVMAQDLGRVTILTSEFDLSVTSKREFRRIKKEVDSMVRELVIEGMRDGSIERADPKFVTFTLTGALNWIARWFD